MAAKIPKLDCDDGVSTMNWSMCALCQRTTPEQLRDTSKSNNNSIGYRTLSDNLQKLSDLNSLPLNIQISLLDTGDGIEKTLMQHCAKWHKSCYSLCNTKQIDRARQKSLTEQNNGTTFSPVKDKLRCAFSSSSQQSQSAPRCFFCEEDLGEIYHKSDNHRFDANVRKMAVDLRDTRLLAKLSAGDMIAQNTLYHKHCSTELFTRYRSLCRKRESSEINNTLSHEAIVLAELVAYMEEIGQSDKRAEHVFRLPDIVKLYRTRLAQLGGDVSKRINGTHLKEKLTKLIPDLECHKSKYEVVLSFKTDVGDMLLQAKRDQDSDAVVLTKAAGIIRNELFKKQYQFNGSLLDKRYDDIPTSLVALVQMILGGTNIKNQTNNFTDLKSPTVSITELLIFNAVRRSRKESHGLRHNLDRETRLPIYLGLFVHNKTRKQALVDKLFEKGLCISYSRIMQISTDMANGVIDMFEEDDMVCPTILREGVFTTGNLDNIDHDPTSTSAQSSFHGTAISLTQHLTHDITGTERHQNNVLITADTPKRMTIKPLMETYTEVPPVTFPNDHPPPCATDVTRGGMPIPQKTLLNSDDMQHTWFVKVDQLKDKERLDEDDNISWSAHFANLQDSTSRPPAISALMPLFRHGAHSLAMIKHGMDIIMKATAKVNPGQVPVMTVDQPLYAIAKKVQWAWPDTYGEEKYVILMGGLHIEMALLKVLGEWMDGSGWNTIMTTANVTTEGRADGLQRGAHAARAQWAHQVTAAALFGLRRQAFATYTVSAGEDNEPIRSFEEWCTEKELHNPQFLYWSQTLKLQVLFLQFMRSQREGHFPLYLEVLGSIIPWMFAMDDFHYARWLSVHVRDLMQLELECPDIWNEFTNGKFVTQKTNRKFSMMAHDQIHEQLNAVVKGDGGIIGITENESALRRWMIAGPENARVLNEVSTLSCDSKCTEHHEQKSGTQCKFATNVRKVVDEFNEIGNPFTETGSELISLSSKVIMDETVIESVRNVEEIGQAQYTSFVTGRMVEMSTPFYDSIRKNGLKLFQTGKQKRTSKSKLKMSSMKSDLELFSRMYISCQDRPGEVDVFFEHENHAWPPSLADHGIMSHGDKADLIECLEPLASRPDTVPDVDVKIIDGAALVHILEPNKSIVSVPKTFKEYAHTVFLPYLYRQLQLTTRVDIVWDAYPANSLKSQTRQARGSGDSLRVTDGTRIPKNWKSFLRVDSNKTELFQFLATCIESASTPTDKLFVSTKGDRVVTSSGAYLSDLQPCTHEEADYRMLLHCGHAYRHGLRKIMIHATDTDVLVLAIVYAPLLPDCELWLAFGHGKTFRFIPAHRIASVLGDDICKGLLFMHAFSGCDNVSSFSGVGKKTAWKVWRTIPSLTATFSRLSQTPDAVTDDDMVYLERYVVLLYSSTSSKTSVNEARKDLFSQGRKVENIPPTREALLQHAKRAAFQAGHVWAQAMVCNPTVPSPLRWGWQNDEDGIWVPLWTTLPEASKRCRELIKCGCKKRCLGLCKCHKANLKCTQLCYCNGQCVNNS